MTSPHPAQSSPRRLFLHPDADGDVGLTEPFGPPPPADEVFPAAMTVADVLNTPSEVMDSLPPGHPSGPTPVVTTGGAGVMTTPPPPPPPPEPEPPRRRRGVVLLVTFVVVALAGAGGAATYAAAHKTVTLDVDGEVATVETFEGDVGDLLAGEGVELTGRDVVTPGVDGALRDGGTVVVRYAHEVTVRADGEQRTAWVAALDADQALSQLSQESGRVVLVPSRAEGRVTLPMRLDADGPVYLVAGGETQRVADGSVHLDELLAANDIAVDADDRIAVGHRPMGDQDAPAVTVVVKDIQTSIVETVSTMPFDTVTATDPDHYEDLGPYVASEGAAGKRVMSWDITEVDGKVVSKEQLNTWVAKAPVDRVIMYGTKKRPEPEPDPKPKSDAKSDTKSKPGSKSDGKSDAKADTKPDAKSDAKSDAKADTKSDAKSDAKSDTETEPKRDAGPDSKRQAEN
ncbi:ubiquitin-like domain-containing protein [Promicromonospora iranensis]|uniref:ubiquitin-like domain-containing protein n=1 Tax=Promicromonospora iranensis TaxID=1105144 RepID=UPI0023A97D7B|nr:ubiquitin-like domain-containing protein [Promicromonospora iranensis]